MDNLLFQIGVVITTIILLMASVAWIDTVNGVLQKLHPDLDPLTLQIIYTIMITIVAVVVMVIFKPFGSTTEHRVPEGIEKAAFEDRPLFLSRLEHV